MVCMNCATVGVTASVNCWPSDSTPAAESWSAGNGTCSSVGSTTRTKHSASSLEHCANRSEIWTGIQRSAYRSCRDCKSSMFFAVSSAFTSSTICDASTEFAWLLRAMELNDDAMIDTRRPVCDGCGVSASDNIG
ncbi:hypothetical protein DQ04_05581060 [Trypanosoma grayi]|uniref:hypothetical protein n=1 Tax=Trypanosoma grayi TaxID=71804 RepID=UPI0004F48C35|nr:hypothetical protein DQ04_05581060 [Trypanosoma grayi]KEG09226.1 hypothetical protein DQ04_05581060 [Trypanosoma grayi]